MKGIYILLGTPLMIVCLICSESAFAQTNFWMKTNLPEASLLGSFAESPEGYIFVCGIFGGVYRSTDNGTSWDLVLSKPRSICLGFGANGHLYSGTTEGELYKSTDNGNTWLTLPTPTGILGIISLLVNQNGQIIIGTVSGNRGAVYQSSNEGTTWLRCKGSQIGRVPEIWKFVKTPQGSILAGGIARHIFASSDGIRWRSVSTRGYLSYSTMIVCADPTTGAVYIQELVQRGDRLLLRSNDGGRTWSKVTLLENIYDPNLGFTGNFYDGVTSRDGDLYLCGSHGVFHSDDNGASWQAVNSGLEFPDSYVRIFMSSNGYLFVRSGWGKIYRSQQPIPMTGKKFPVALNENERPSEFALDQNYPNPFNPTTTIEFGLANDALVTVKVFNSLGQEVATLAEQEEFVEGDNELEFDANNLPSGVYFYRLTAQDVETGKLQFSNVRKMLLLK